MSAAESDSLALQGSSSQDTRWVQLRIICSERRFNFSRYDDSDSTDHHLEIRHIVRRLWLFHGSFRKFTNQARCEISTTCTEGMIFSPYIECVDVILNI